MTPGRLDKAAASRQNPSSNLLPFLLWVIAIGVMLGCDTSTGSQYRGKIKGQPAAEIATAHGIRLEVVKLASDKRGFVLLPRRWIVERSLAWLARFRLSRDYERLPTTLAGVHWLAFACLLLKNLFKINCQS